MKSTEAQDQLLALIDHFISELHPDTQSPVKATLKDGLERDLGFDSLSRVELFARIEKGFGIHLPEHLLAEAETVVDLLQDILAAAPSKLPELSLVPRRAAPEAVATLPHHAGTLPEVLQWHVQRHPQRVHIHLYGEGEEPEEISYADLLAGAQRVAAGLQQLGLQPGQTVAIMLPTGRDYLYSFYAVLLCGGIPVPIYPPQRLSQLEEHLNRHVGILANARSVVLITVTEALNVARLLRARLELLRDIVTVEALSGEDAVPDAVAIEAGDIAFLQYTSGSTGQPKGVMLSHNDLLANIRAMGEATEAGNRDVFISWLPLYHDMGLIGAWLGSLYYAIPLVLMSPLRFLARPSRWLWAIHHHRGTLSAAPNFAYELCLGKVSEEEIEGLDLSSWRMAFNGAEPVSPRTLERFAGRFSAYGLQQSALSPVYGLAEAAVGLAFPPLGRGALIDHIGRERFLTSGEALPAVEGEKSLALVACGRPLPGYQIRVVDQAGRELPERREGRIQFQGPSATQGYYRNPEESSKLYAGDWLETGDIGYIAAGDLYLASRSKEIIIRGGRNLYPYETEEAVGGIPGIRKGCVALFGSADTSSGTERLILVAETRESDETVRQRLREQARGAALDLLDLPPDELLLVPPHTVLKTSSGKIRRGAVRALYEEGQLGRPTATVGMQFIRLAVAALVPGLRRLKRRLREELYGRYVQLLFWMFAPTVWLLVAVTPGIERRWSIMGGMARLFLRLAGYRLRVEGRAELPVEGAAVLVANHASYLDGIVMAAVLPKAVGFVAKAELAKQRIAGLFLRRIGAAFVERFDKQQGRLDAERTAKRLADRERLFYFPEGTLTRTPGLMPFRMGAFVAAAKAGVPVVPVIIRGTRSILRSESWFPHRGDIKVHIAKPLRSDEREWAAAVVLRDASRRAILDQLGEPDLAKMSDPLAGNARL
ncbi:MAG: AMP-binding protein [Candidatus Sedimenticola sp. (ex Thyasira tokunagai)]